MDNFDSIMAEIEGKSVEHPLPQQQPQPQTQPQQQPSQYNTPQHTPAPPSQPQPQPEPTGSVFKVPFTDEEVRLTPDEEEVLKRNGIGAVLERLTKRSANEGFARASAMYEEKLKAIEAQAQKQNEALARQRQEDFLRDLEREVPSLRQLMQDPGFQAYLGEGVSDPSSSTPVPRSALLDRAYHAMNVGYIAYVVRQYEQQRGQQDGTVSSPFMNATPSRAPSSSPVTMGNVGAPRSAAGMRARYIRDHGRYMEALDKATRDGSIKNPTRYKQLVSAEKALADYLREVEAAERNGGR